MKALVHGSRINRCLIHFLALPLTMSLSVSTLAQGIFDGLPYNERAIRDTLARHTLQLSSIDHSVSIPKHIFYQQVFFDFLSDAAVMAQLPAADAAVIRALPAHQDATFVEKDQRELAAVCEVVDATGEQNSLLGAAQAFDQSRQRREHDLDIHYETVMTQLGASTQQLVLHEMAEVHSQRHITYAVFSLGALAAEAPDLAGAIVRSGCESFADTAFELQSITLLDQLRDQNIMHHNNQ